MLKTMAIEAVVAAANSKRNAGNLVLKIKLLTYKLAPSLTPCSFTFAMRDGSGRDKTKGHSREKNPHRNVN